MNKLLLVLLVVSFNVNASTTVMCNAQAKLVEAMVVLRDLNVKQENMLEEFKSRNIVNKTVLDLVEIYIPYVYSHPEVDSSTYYSITFKSCMTD